MRVLMGGNVGVEEFYEASVTGSRTSLLPITEGLCYRWQGCSGTDGRGWMLPEARQKDKIDDFYRRK